MTSPLPSVDRLLRDAALAPVLAAEGHALVTQAVRAVLERHRAGLRAGVAAPEVALLLDEVVAAVAALTEPALRRVFNLTGTVLHTNLGRAPLSEAAIAHAAMAMREACALEFDVGTGKRGERDSLVEPLLCELTGAEAATVVNNNAAAVLLMLAAVAGGREVVVSRGELIEIGGAFRIPDVMRAAGVRLVEVGTTNRTHPRDYEGAVGPETAALMKVHTSNYRVTGFTAAVDEAGLAGIARAHGLPMICDLGAGSLVDLTKWGLPAEPVVRDVLAAGADLVSFSGDKLLGGPQAGLIVGRRDLIEQVRRHPLKRALRLSKVVLAALEATLLAYRRPDRLAEELPAFRLLTRPVAELRAAAERLRPVLAGVLGADWAVSVVDSAAQVGSGALPDEAVASVALACVPVAGGGGALDGLAARLRGLRVPVIGRIAEGALLLDLRGLADEAGLAGVLAGL
ncbi:MAG: L-seryl-tRNA(Sec) selenium transferase [Sphingomonadales bacterium]|nr:L-seryl-tRNA(Sec) selenium transferase [Sphingomonadales bacterium]